jgi:hypothetical protein
LCSRRAWQGAAIERGKIIIDNAIDSTNGFHKEVADETGFTTRNLICVPMRSVMDRSITGAVELLQTHPISQITVRFFTLSLTGRQDNVPEPLQT